MMKYIFSFLLITSLSSCQNQASFRDELAITTLEGNIVELNEYADKVIFLNLWATWCAPCIKEMPSIEAVSKKFGDKVEFILASNEEMEKIIQFKTKKSFDLNYVFMNTSPESMGVYALPATFIIGKNGEIAFEEKGSRDWNSEESINLINRIINE
ncbi:TlpA family protein disulfide reductase [Fulvivirga lutimaris]|nr:TlpA family protein disulfide reductase [Fulvivirga lutimaris]